MMKFWLNSVAVAALITSLGACAESTGSQAVRNAPVTHEAASASTPSEPERGAHFTTGKETLPPLLPAEADATSANPPAPTQAHTAEEARTFIATVEKDLAEQSELDQRTQWVRNTYITPDTEWLQARADADFNARSVKWAKAAAAFNDVAVDAASRRKLNLLKLSLTLPAPDRDGAAQELSEISTRLDSTYATGKFTYAGKVMNLTDASNFLAKSRDPKALRAVWEGWHGIAAPMKADYARLAALSNEGAQGLGYKDAGALWRSGYDMDADAFADETDRLWGQLKPFYENLHCYVRRKLNAKYGDAIQPKHGAIRADLLGNMWAQDWSGIYDLVAPSGTRSSYSLDRQLLAKHYTAEKIIRTGEGFYVSLGLDPLPKTFWERSQITRPRDREVVCHASAWDVDNLKDVRVKMCTQVDGDSFYTAHHELGHNYYQRAYSGQDFLFKGGAHDGFHEAIGDFIGLSSVTPTYLNQIGVLDKIPSDAEDLPYLMKMALQKIAFVPFGLMVDRWRWEVFAGRITPQQYNDRWWALARDIQGIEPPGVRPASAFDAGAKYHVAASVPYTRYFLAQILQFQFQKAACDQIGWKGPLHRCSIYGEKAVGEKLNAMLAMGQSKPWPDALEAFTGTRDMDASAMAAYFKPLNDYLSAQNVGQDCGW